MSAKKAEKSSGLRRSPCPVANTLDLVGDKWSLLIIRDMRHGKRTYGELAQSPEGVPTNILADRLRRDIDRDGSLEGTDQLRTAALRMLTNPAIASALSGVSVMKAFKARALSRS